MSHFSDDVATAFAVANLGCELAEAVLQWETLSHMTHNDWLELQAIATKLLKCMRKGRQIR